MIGGLEREKVRGEEVTDQTSDALAEFGAGLNVVITVVPATMEGRRRGVGWAMAFYLGIKESPKEMLNALTESPVYWHLNCAVGWMQEGCMGAKWVLVGWVGLV